MAQIRHYRQKLPSPRPQSPKLNTPRLLKLNLCRIRRQRNRTHLLPKFLQHQKRQQRHPPKRPEFCPANVDDKSEDVHCCPATWFSRSASRLYDIVGSSLTRSMGHFTLSESSSFDRTQSKFGHACNDMLSIPCMINLWSSTNALGVDLFQFSHVSAVWL